MNKYIKFPLVLGIVALLSGALLAFTYQLTKERIQQGVIERQANAINDMFEEIDTKVVKDIPSEFESKGITSIVEVTSNSNVYNCYTINYKDSADGDNITIIIALDKECKVYGVKFVSIDNYISSNYNNQEYLDSVVEKDSFDVISNATLSANDLNEVLNIAKECFKRGN